MQLSKIGGTDDGGVNRQALTQKDFEAQELCIFWANQFGLSISHDPVGNLFFQLKGKDPSLPVVMSGSHLDTQPTGGKFDGAFGVLAGLEAVRAIIESGVSPRRGIEIVAWMNEEGSRFAPGMMGSETFAGLRTLESIKKMTDQYGVSVEEELKELEKRFSFSEKRLLGQEVFCFVEAHIEQGPILEREGFPVGVVTGIQGVRRMRVRVTGDEAHAGTTPYALRRDAIEEASRAIEKLYSIFSNDETTRFTVGRLILKPNVPSVVASEVLFSIDLRHPDSEKLAEAERRVRIVISDAMERCMHKVWCIAASDTVMFDERILQTIENVSKTLGIPSTRIFSGAGHDARQMAHCCPTGMIFVPSCDGISHNVNEYTSQDDIISGTTVLCNVLAQLANSSDLI
tara:strand:- start:2343 stop:3542 length:1200 start_codon:yes stop_codon:yes gene_type:complete